MFFIHFPTTSLLQQFLTENLFYILRQKIDIKTLSRQIDAINFKSWKIDGRNLNQGEHFFSENWCQKIGISEKILGRKMEVEKILNRKNRCKKLMSVKKF